MINQGNSSMIATNLLRFLAFGSCAAFWAVLIHAALSFAP